MKRQSFLIILCACVCVLDTGAQTRLSVLPWHERDSIVAAKAEADVYTDIPDKQPFFLVYQEDNDRYSMKWICDYYDKKGNIHNDSSMIRAFAPSDRYCYSVSVIGETFYPDHEIVQMANVELDEDLNVIFSEATGDVTVYTYGIDENERVTGVFENPTRHAQKIRHSYRRTAAEQRICQRQTHMEYEKGRTDKNTHRYRPEPHGISHEGKGHTD